MCHADDSLCEFKLATDYVEDEPHYSQNRAAGASRPTSSATCVRHLGQRIMPFAGTKKQTVNKPNSSNGIESSKILLAVTPDCPAQVCVMNFAIN
jgi:hypothetical protein